MEKYINRPVLGDGTFLRICPFLLGCTFYWYIVACSSLMILCISVVSNLFFIFNFIDLSLLHFSWQVWLKVYQDLFKEPASLIFSVFSVSVPFISAKSFFLSTNFGFLVILLSPVALDTTRLRFFLFPEVRLYCNKLHS